MEQLKKLAPPGFNLAADLGIYAFGLGISFMISLAYFIRLFDARSEYIVWSTVQGKMINPDFEMPYFAELIEGVFAGFIFVALAALLRSVSYRMYYSSGGSRTMYLISRLPDRWYLVKTCFTVPLLMAAASLITALVLIIIYYGIYLIATPEGYLLPGQWARLWSF